MQFLTKDLRKASKSPFKGGSKSRPEILRGMSERRCCEDY